MPKDYISIIIAITGIFISLISIVIASFSLSESRITRKSTKQPLLVLESIFSYLIIKNIGTAPAYNINVFLKKYNMDELIGEEDTQFAFSYILPNETVKQLSYDPQGDFEHVTVLIEFESIYKEKYQMTYKVSQNERGEGRSIFLVKSRVI